MSKYLLIILLIFNVSCKNNDNIKKDESKIDTIITNPEAVTNKLDIEDKTTDIVNCPEMIANLVKLSSLQNAFKEELKVEIESRNSVNMKLRLFIEDSDNTVGWIVFDAENKRLLDITNDIENPEELGFDVKKWNAIIDCSFEKNKSYYIGNDQLPDKKNCKTTSVEMESTEECIFENSSIQEVYEALIKNKEIYDTASLPKSIPKSDQNIKVNNSGLMDIEYKIEKNKVQIILNYAGGVTTVIIEQLKEKVKRTIISCAD